MPNSSTFEPTTILFVPSYTLASRPESAQVAHAIFLTAPEIQMFDTSEVLAQSRISGGTWTESKSLLRKISLGTPPRRVEEDAFFGAVTAFG